MSEEADFLAETVIEYCEEGNEGVVYETIKDALQEARQAGADEVLRHILEKSEEWNFDFVPLLERFRPGWLPKLKPKGGEE